MKEGTLFSPEDAEKYESLGCWEQLSLGEHLDCFAQAYSDREALIFGGERFTYEELRREADRLARALLQKGVRPGDFVAVQLPNSSLFVILSFALFKMGAIPIYTMPAHREAELSGIFQKAKPKAYVVCKKYLGFQYAEMAERLRRNNPSVEIVLFADPDADFYAANNLAEEASMAVAVPSSRSLALFLLSGGTTGIPKLIPRTHADYAYNAKTSAYRCKLDQNSVYLTVLPAGHNFPLGCPGWLGTFFKGGKVVMASTPSPDETFLLIEQEKVTITALVPALVNLWLQALEWNGADISSLELLQVGGSPLDRMLAERIFSELGCTLQNVFGTAEGFESYTSPDDHQDVILNTQGKPLSPYDDVKIVDDDGNFLDQGCIGELYIKGPYSIRGYYNADEHNEKDFTNDGYYKTGDMGLFTDGGNLKITGRKKEQINRAGEKIATSEVESYLNALPGVESSAVIAVPDEKLGEKICAAIRSDRELSLKHVHDFFRELGVAQYKFPDQLKRVASWPLTGVGKVDKKELLKLFEKGTS
jgi:yersiniabactin salicyl-AMP ligase